MTILVKLARPMIISHRMKTYIVSLFLVSSVLMAQETTNTPVKLPTVTVQGTPESQELIRPYNQPRWSARGRFSSETDVYVLPPWSFYVDLDYQGTVPKHGDSVHLFTQEFELGLPHRFQLAYENNVEVQSRRTQVTMQTIEARYALADWGKIPLNPTLFAEYKFGVGKDYGAEEDPGDPAPRIPDAFEIRLLVGEQFAQKFQWSLNIFHEQETGGEREWETGFSQALSYALRDEYLKVGVEMQFIRRSDAEDRSRPEYEFELGPSFTWKPTRRTRFDVAALFGATHDSPVAKVFVVFSIGFGKGDEEAEGTAPISTQNR